MATTTRDWLLAESPASRMQARLGRSYRMFRALLRNPLAVLGGLIVLALVVLALFAPYFATHNPYASVLTDRLQPGLAKRRAHLEGFYDESHFDREFRWFMGTTPMARLRQEARFTTTIGDHLLEG